jgi:hypothetical protein
LAEQYRQRGDSLTAIDLSYSAFVVQRFTATLLAHAARNAAGTADEAPLREEAIRVWQS